ncbi:unnamed protein product, partial [Mesorhabditis belari]|uniref:Digestive organ expansion factor homolog n=1 Tax=Mesorhabditis belari TaxID=2138241 RepID=A0AAF3EBJ4_9BILA
MPPKRKKAGPPKEEIANESEEDSLAKRVHKDPNLWKDFIDAHFAADRLSTLTLPKTSRTTSKYKLPSLGDIVHFKGCDELETPIGKTIRPEDAGWSDRLTLNYRRLLEQSSDIDENANSEIFSLLSQYVDFTGNPSASSNYRLCYVGHLLNHVIKTRNLILQNKKKLEEIDEINLDDATLQSTRDQGFVRPCVLVLLPFRKDAFEVVNIMESLVFGGGEKPNVANRKRFKDEFGDTGYRVSGARLVEETFRDTMEGNVDDCFRMGVAISKKELKLYSPFSKSDIILCSPLGLRMILNGDQGDESQFISSIQIVVADKCDVLLQQNWEHVITIFKWLNKKPKQIEADIRRVRTLYLDGTAAHYCQTLLFGDYQHEQFTSLSLKHSLSHCGLVLHYPTVEGVLDKVNIPICQELHRINVKNAEESSDARFQYFKDKLLGKLEMHTMIFIPSRNVESFVQCHEYAPDNKISRARDLFYHGKKKLLLVTERFHFFKRFHLRGAKNILFYQLPNDPSFYANMINMCSSDGMRVKAILPFSQFDRLRLSNVFGKQMAAGILKSEKQIQAIVSE